MPHTCGDRLASYEYDDSCCYPCTFRERVIELKDGVIELPGATERERRKKGAESPAVLKFVPSVDDELCLLPSCGMQSIPCTRNACRKATCTACEQLAAMFWSNECYNVLAGRVSQHLQAQPRRQSGPTCALLHLPQPHDWCIHKLAIPNDVNALVEHPMTAS